MPILYWVLFSLIAYCYLGYPLILWVVSLFFAIPIRKANYLPHVSIVISVHNEEDVIERKINNLLSINHPYEKLEILIGSDGSTDKTNEILRKFHKEGLVIVEYVDRRGKASVVNDLVQKAHGEIIFFTDARQRLEASAVREIVKNFSDPSVGCASGELVFNRAGGATAKGINLYWDYEKFIRKNESRIHSMLGATGAIYAIRREFFEPIAEDIILDDMFVPFTIIQKGYRAIFDDTAKAYDEVAKTATEEHRRKTRTLSGNYQIFRRFKRLFNPLKSPIAIQLFSHKFLRVVAPFLLIALFAVNAAMLGQSFYRLLFAAQIFFYMMAITGALSRNKKHGILKLISQLCYVPYVFCLLNFSALVGFFRFFSTKQDVTWKKARGKI